MPCHLVFSNHHRRLRHLKHFLRLAARRRDGDCLKDRGHAQLKLELQSLARRDVKHASNFAKASLLHADNVIRCQDLIECEVTTLIRERALCFKTRGAEEDNRCAADRSAILVQHGAGNLS